MEERTLGLLHRALAIVVGAFLLVVLAACGGEDSSSSPVSSTVSIHGTVNLPVSGTLSVESGSKTAKVDGNRFSIDVAADSTQSITVLSGDKPVGLAIIPQPSLARDVVVDSQSTSAGLVFLAPGVAEGTPERDAAALQRITELAPVQDIAKTISDGLSRDPAYLRNLSITADPTFSSAYANALAQYLAALSTEQQPSSQGVSLVSALPIDSVTNYGSAPAGVVASDDGAVTVAPPEASGVSIAVIDAANAKFQATNTRTRYVDLYDGDTKVADLDPTGWMNLYGKLGPPTTQFGLQPQGRTQVALEAYGPGLHNIPALNTPELSKLLWPTIESGVFLTVIPGLNAVLGVSDVGKLHFLEPLVEQVLRDSAAIAKISHDYVKGDLLALTIDVTKVVLHVLELDFKLDPARSILAQYAGRALASSLVNNAFMWFRVATTAISATDVVVSLSTYTLSNAHDTFTVTFGSPATYAISGSVYADSNGNGAQDSGETGSAGATVTLSGAASAAASSDASGNYLFPNLKPGNYTVTLSAPSAYQTTTVNPVSVTVPPNATVNFGIAPASAPAAKGKIAFVSDRDGNQEVYVMNTDGTGVTNLTNNPANDLGPAWSPDGSRIAFTSDRDGNQEVYVMNTDGTGVTNLTGNPTPDRAPAWSPDGTRIAFDSIRGANWDIYIMNADGSGQVNLINDSTLDHGPAWSPDGTRIAFYSLRVGPSEVYVMNADGAGQTNVTNNPAYDMGPAWSPDGTRIAFMSDRGGNWDIYIMNADGSGLTSVTTNPAYDVQPTWSPDGTRIAFYSDPDGNQEVYVMNTDGTGVTNLTNNPAHDVQPAWSPVP